MRPHEPLGTADTDSGGVPFAGRTLPPSPFAGDTGAADPRLLAATGGPDEAFFAALVGARLLVPVVNAPDTEFARLRTGDLVEKSSGMALVTLELDGLRALPVFSSTQALEQWDPQARPVPVTSERASEAAIVESCHTLVFDPGSEHEREVRASMIWALVQQRTWLPSYADPFVSLSVQKAAAPIREIQQLTVEEGDPAGQGVLRLVLHLVSGLTERQVEAVAEQLGERLAHDGELRARVDQLTVRVL